MQARTGAIILIAVTGLLIAAVLGRRAFANMEPHVEVDRHDFPVTGIDISAHNGEVDFEKVARAGIDFVFIKATEGATWRDSRYDANYAAARAAGLSVGVYHFFRFDVEAWRQSVNILSALGNRRLDLPVAIDVEEANNSSEFTTDEVCANLRALIDMLRTNGREVIIYTNKSGYHRFVRGRFDDVDLWICSFTSPAIPEARRWTVWQHSHQSRVPGIDGIVDLNTFNTPRHGPFEAWLSKLPQLPGLASR